MDGNLAILEQLEIDENPISIIIRNYKNKISELKAELKGSKYSITLALNIGKINAYEKIIQDLEHLV